MSSIIIKLIRGYSSKPSDLTDNTVKPGRVKDLTGTEDLSTICLPLDYVEPGANVSVLLAGAEFFPARFNRNQINDDFH